jgi:glutaredoxin
MADDEIIIYGTCWCSDCVRTRQFLGKIGITYRWVNIDQDKDGERFVLRNNRGMRSVPTILFNDGSVLVEPSNAELQSKLKQLNMI